MGCLDFEAPIAMDAAPDLDFPSSIRHALTRTMASVTSGEIAPVMARCSLHPEARGAHAVMEAAQVGPDSIPDPAWTAPMAAFDRMFAG